MSVSQQTLYSKVDNYFLKIGKGLLNLFTSVAIDMCECCVGSMRILDSAVMPSSILPEQRLE